LDTHSVHSTSGYVSIVVTENPFRP
jgi:hypothetical protein